MGRQGTVAAARPRPLGAHMSIAGGVARAVERAVQVRADALQVFTKNQLQWRAAPLSTADAAEFRDAVRAAGIRFVCAHGTYLVNLASPDAELRARSLETLALEARRAAALGCACLVLHPGSPQGDGPRVGVKRVAAGLQRVLEATADLPVRLALENTAGQGTVLGAQIAQLGVILDAAGRHPRLGLCLDTCHAFAAGYDLRTPQAVAALAAQIGAHVGLERLLVLHLNDSSGECGRHLDRHTHIGRGHIGDTGFRHLLHEPAFRGVPGVIETPKDERTLIEDRRNLQRLRRLERQTG